MSMRLTTFPSFWWSLSGAHHALVCRRAQAEDRPAVILPAAHYLADRGRKVSVSSCDVLPADGNYHCLPDDFCAVRRGVSAGRVWFHFCVLCDGRSAHCDWNVHFVADRQSGLRGGYCHRAVFVQLLQRVFGRTGVFDQPRFCPSRCACWRHLSA